MARPTGLEPVTYGLAYHYNFRCPLKITVCGLDYIFAISGGARIVSTDPLEQPALPRCHPTALGKSPLDDRPHGYKHSGFLVSSVLPSPSRVKVSPIQCPPLWKLCFPPEAPVCHPHGGLEGRCSIRLSYGRNFFNFVHAIHGVTLSQCLIPATPVASGVLPPATLVLPCTSSLAWRSSGKRFV